MPSGSHLTPVERSVPSQTLHVTEEILSLYSSLSASQSVHSFDPLAAEKVPGLHWKQSRAPLKEDQPAEQLEHNDEGGIVPIVPRGHGLVGSIGSSVTYHPLATAMTEDPPEPTT